MTAAPPRVLVVSREDPERGVVVEAVRAAGHRVMATEQATAALAQLAEDAPGILVVDLALGAEALRLLRAAANQPRPLPVVALADRRRPAASAEALRLGAIDVVARPAGAAEVQAALANALEHRDALGHHGESEPALPPDGSLLLSLGLQEMLEGVRHLAHSRCHVLLVGEPGTGKEILARAIHATGGEAAASFETINCTYLAPRADSTEEVERFELRLFRALMNPGSAAPGTRHRAPAPGARHPGTIFLKGLHDLPLPVQGTMERLLAERDAAPPGERVVPRVMASAEPSIGDAVERKRFRRDLYDRLAVVRLDLPPIRQRPQDIPLLASLFLKDACRRHDVSPKTFAPPARALLSALPWRGNASELRQITERLALVASRRVIQLEDLLAQVRFDGAEARGQAEGTLREARERFERDYIASVLQRHRGRMGPAAEELGIERTNLYRKMKQLKIRL